MAFLLGLVELDYMEREYVRCLDRSDWLTLAFTAFSFHKLDSNIILRKSGPLNFFNQVEKLVSRTVDELKIIRFLSHSDAFMKS